jgi:hypothetical protein
MKSKSIRQTSVLEANLYLRPDYAGAGDEGES